MGRTPLQATAVTPAYEQIPIEAWPYIGICGVCGLRQYLVPGGTSCANHHGGADTIIPESADMTLGLMTMEEAERLRGKMMDLNADELEKLARKGGGGNPYPKMSESTTTVVKMAEPFARILEHVFKVDPWKDYSALEEALKIGGRGFTDHETLMRALDAAEDNARKAHQLYCASRAEQERWELDAQVVESAARREVVRELEAEKETGQRRKQITEADVSAYIQLKYPDEYDRLRLTRLKLRKLVEHMERLADLWSSRCRTLQTMLGKSR